MSDTVIITLVVVGGALAAWFLWLVYKASGTFSTYTPPAPPPMYRSTKITTTTTPEEESDGRADD